MAADAQLVRHLRQERGRSARWFGCGVAPLRWIRDVPSGEERGDFGIAGQAFDVVGGDPDRIVVAGYQQVGIPSSLEVGKRREEGQVRPDALARADAAAAEGLAQQRAEGESVVVVASESATSLVGERVATRPIGGRHVAVAVVVVDLLLEKGGEQCAGLVVEEATNVPPAGGAG
jgi:hypothetical protein